MDFKVVNDEMRKRVDPNPRRIRSPLVQALLDGRTIAIAKDDRKKVGGNASTLRKHGFKLRSGIVGDQVVVWADPLVDA